MKTQKLAFKIVTLLVMMVLISGCNNTDGSASLNNDNTDSQPSYDKEMIYYRRGAESPKIILEEYSDFFCPHCRNVQPVLKQLLADFPDSLALEYHNFTFLGSYEVHHGSECAGEQDKYWEFHDLAYTNQNNLRVGGREAIVKLAQDLGMDTVKFEQCMESNKYQSKISEQMRIAHEKYDISATPTFIIGGKVAEIMNGETYYDGLKRIIDTYLNKPIA